MMTSVARWGETIQKNVRKAIYGKDDVVTSFLVALLCDGHLLLEDVPGVGKTILARAIAASLECDMKRLQCTPDLMPADVTGVSVYNQQNGEFEFHEGPVETNILLVDEINRAGPRTQSALLEAMEERAISVEGKRRPLPDPFILLATENPVEFDGTFPLPAAQKDRFFLCTTMGYPDPAAERQILESQRRISHPVEDVGPVTSVAELRAIREEVRGVEVAENVSDFILDLLEATRTDPRLLLGASPRAGKALFRGCKALAALDGRRSATVEDVRRLVPTVLWKRVELSADSLLGGATARSVVEEVLSHLSVTDPPEPRSQEGSR